MVMRATSINCERIKNTFAILSILIYVADASIMLELVAINDKSGFAKEMIITDNTRYILSDIKSPVFMRLVNSFLLVATLPIKKKSGKIIASFIIS